MYVCNDSMLQCVPHVCSVYILTLREATTAPDGFIGDEFNCTGECMLHIYISPVMPIKMFCMVETLYKDTPELRTPP